MSELKNLMEGGKKKSSRGRSKTRSTSTKTKSKSKSRSTSRSKKSKGKKKMRGGALINKMIDSAVVGIHKIVGKTVDGFNDYLKQLDKNFDKSV